MVKLLIFHISLKLKGLTTYEYILRNLNKVRPARRGINNQHDVHHGGEIRHPKNQDDSREEFSDHNRAQGHDVNLRFPESGMRRHREDHLDVPPVRPQDLDPTNQEISKTNLKDSARYELPQKMDSRRSVIAQADQVKPLPPKRRSHDFTEDLSQDEKIESLKNLSFLQLQQVFKTIEMDECKNDHKNSASNVGYDLTQSKMTNVDLEKSALKQSRSEGDFSRLGERQTSRGGLKPISQISQISQAKLPPVGSPKLVNIPVVPVPSPVPIQIESPNQMTGRQPDIAQTTIETGRKEMKNDKPLHETRDHKPEAAVTGDG